MPNSIDSRIAKNKINNDDFTTHVKEMLLTQEDSDKGERLNLNSLSIVNGFKQGDCDGNSIRGNVSYSKNMSHITLKNIMNKTELNSLFITKRCLTETNFASRKVSQLFPEEPAAFNPLVFIPRTLSGIQQST
ncbi:hypothetical protein CDAR_284321 [Caerostris darwini]|uniref:Uncharacterized protein n=1 Tax=Caerostris darwini TaxID=1538125 RepID=A0AAV4UPH0_9ARAC|nr:hypothetical protein CDAR_284321 [Caerostris darwini]